MHVNKIIPFVVVEYYYAYYLFSKKIFNKIVACSE